MDAITGVIIFLVFAVHGRLFYRGYKKLRG